MSKEEEKKKKPLSDDRYDAKLFKQAYKAAKVAKEIERKSKKKKSFLKVLLTFSIVLLISVLIYFLLPLISKKPEYIEGKERYIYFTNDIVEQTETISPLLNEINISSELSAESILVYDPNTGEILFEKDAEKERAVASLTKLLSAIVVLENYNLEEVVSVSREYIPEDLDWQLELEEGDRVSVENLLKAMLISSYNDAAYIVANAYPYGGYEGFIKAMNSKASKLRMVNSNFANPAGLDDEKNYSTAKDIAILLSVAKRYEMITQLVNTGFDTIYWYSNEELVSKKIYTTNQLYGVNQYIQGFKTGVTKEAKECFAGYFIYPNNQELITIVLGSEERFEDTKILEGYVRRNLLRE
jgi:D-alanyl-D-alanine carboxypeptidase (penicillin-binding protein 5/6)